MRYRGAGAWQDARVGLRLRSLTMCIAPAWGSLRGAQNLYGHRPANWNGGRGNRNLSNLCYDFEILRGDAIRVSIFLRPRRSRVVGGREMVFERGGIPSKTKGAGYPLASVFDSTSSTAGRISISLLAGLKPRAGG